MKKMTKRHIGTALALLMLVNILSAAIMLSSLTVTAAATTTVYHNDFSGEALDTLPNTSDTRATWSVTTDTSSPLPVYGKVVALGGEGEKAFEINIKNGSTPTTASKTVEANLTFGTAIQAKYVVIDSKIKKIGSSSDGLFMGIPIGYGYGTSSKQNLGGLIIANNDANGGPNNLSVYKGGWKSPLGTSMQILSSDTDWRNVKLILDYTNKTMTAIVDGILIIKDHPFRNPVTNLEEIRFSIQFPSGTAANRSATMQIKDVKVTAGDTIRDLTNDPVVPLALISTNGGTLANGEVAVTATFNQATDINRKYYDSNNTLQTKPVTDNVSLYKVDNGDVLIPTTDYIATYDNKTFTYKVQSIAGFAPGNYELRFNQISNAIGDSIFTGTYTFTVPTSEEEPYCNEIYSNDFSGEVEGGLPATDEAGNAWSATGAPLVATVTTISTGEKVLQLDNSADSTNSTGTVTLTLAEPIAEKYVVISASVRKGIDSNSNGKFMNLINLKSSDATPKNLGGVAAGENSQPNDIQMRYNNTWTTPIANEKILVPNSVTGANMNWRHIQLIANMNLHTFNLIVDGALFAVNVPFRDTTANDIKIIEFATKGNSKLCIKDINITAGNVVRLTPTELALVNNSASAPIDTKDAVVATFNQGTNINIFNYNNGPTSALTPLTAGVALYKIESGSDILIPTTDYDVTYNRYAFTYSVKSKTEFLPGDYKLSFTNIGNAFGDSTFTGDYTFTVIKRVGFYTDNAKTIPATNLAEVFNAAGKTVYVNINTSGLELTEGKAAVILALFDNTGTICKIELAEQTMPIDNMIYTSMSLADIDDIANYKLKIFIWDGLSKITPLVSRNYDLQ